MRTSTLLPSISFVALLAVGCGSNGDSPSAPIAPSTGGSSSAGASLGGAAGSGVVAGQGGAPVAGSGGTATGGIGGSLAGASGSTSGGAGASTMSTGGAGAGGASGSGQGGADAAALLADCTTFWTKRCTELSTCFPTTFASEYADIPSCTSQNAQRCASLTIGSASNTTLADVESCFSAYGDLSCSLLWRFLNENSARPSQCNYPPGNLPMGASCSQSNECASQYCLPSYTACGTCAPLPAMQAACAFDAQCAPGFTCSGYGCLPYAEDGEICAYAACHSDEACVNDGCAPRLTDGSLCVGGYDSCLVESVCNGLTNVCVPLSTAQTGQPCGWDVTGGETVCVGDSRCDLNDAGVGTCVPIAEVGEACTFDGQCDSSSSCVDGVCSPTSPSGCGDAGAAGGAAGSAGAAGTSGAGAGGALDHGSPSDVYPAPHPPPPQALKGPAPVLSAPVFQPLVFPNDAIAPFLTTFLEELVTSTYFASTTSEYGVSPPSTAPPYTIMDEVFSPLDDVSVQELLLAHVNAGEPEFPADPNVIYTIFFPSTILIEDRFFGTSCQSFAGYHGSTVAQNGATISYVVVPRCGSVDEVTSSASHELVEAITDPRVADEFLSYYGLTDPAWEPTGGELADLCETGPSNSSKIGKSGRRAQSTWSNQSALAGHSPCVPWSGPYFGAAPVLTDDIDVFGTTSKGVKVAIGESRVVELDLFSDQTTNGPFSVAAKQYTYGSPTSLSLSLDKKSGQNGEKLYLTITVLGPAPYGGPAILEIDSTSAGAVTQWWAAVGQ